MTTEQKHEMMEQVHQITIPGLPDGWRAVAYREPVEGEYYMMEGIHLHGPGRCEEMLIVEKIKPHRIVLEEISKEEYHRLFNDERCSDIYNMRGSYWRLVEEE